MKSLPASLLLAVMYFCGASVYGQCEPFFGKLLINEVMPANDVTATDPAGEYDDWVEIVNTTDEAINLEGYFLSDNHGNKTKYVFPDVEIAANGYLIVWCDNQIEQEGLHAPFNLSSMGEEVGLYNPDTTSVDFVRYGDMPDDISIGRFPDGAGPFNILIPTFNGENTNSVNPGLVINEYQAQNESTVQDQWGGYEDWVELYNNSNSPINLEGYFLSDKIGDPTQFVFPDTTIGANDYLIIWCDQGLFEPGLHTFFKLGGSGDDIILSDSDTLTIDYVRYMEQIPDDSEGRFPNGVGPISCMIPTHEMSNGEINSVADASKDILKIWPNPAKSSFWIEIEPNKSTARVELFDMQGRKVIDKTLPAGLNEIFIENLPEGVYLVRAEEYWTKLVVN